MRHWMQVLFVALPLVAAVAVVAYLARPGSHARPAATVLVIGDSLADGLAGGIRRHDPQHSQYVVLNETRISSGLKRRDAFDWPEVLGRLIAEKKPTAIVVLIGLNDAKTYNPEAQDDYRARIRALMDVAEQSAVQTVWVGLPAMREPALNRNAAVLDALFRDEVARRPRVRFVDLRQPADGGPAFEPYAANEHGIMQKFREQDGIHFTSFGYDTVGRLVVEALAR